MTHGPIPCSGSVISVTPVLCRGIRAVKVGLLQRSARPAGEIDWFMDSSPTCKLADSKIQPTDKIR